MAAVPSHPHPIPPLSASYYFTMVWLPRAPVHGQRACGCRACRSLSAARSQLQSWHMGRTAMCYNEPMWQVRMCVRHLATS